MIQSEQAGEIGFRIFNSTVQVVCKKRGFDDPLCSIVVVVQGIGTNQAAAHKEATPNFLTHFLSFLASLQGCRKRGAGGALDPSVFGRSVNPISTRGAHYPHPVLRAPPGYQTLRRPCIPFCKIDK